MLTANFSTLGSPASQAGKKCPSTRSPAANAVTPESTPGPSATTSPAPPETGTSGSFCFGLYWPSSISQSRKFSEQAFTRTSTSPAAGGAGCGRSAITRAVVSPSGAKRCSAIARISVHACGGQRFGGGDADAFAGGHDLAPGGGIDRDAGGEPRLAGLPRSEEHPAELQSLMRTSYAVFCL